MEISEVAAGILAGHPRAIAKGISLFENNSQRAKELMKQIFPYSGSAIVIGLTGSPGAGKSTLLDQLIASFRKIGKKIGLIAVDPSSPFTGGAILGDRIRMMRHSLDDEVFIRSMATRGNLGGLAKATGEAVTVLEAAGKEIIFVETVGVGQDEVEIVKLADIVVVVLTPGAGDDIQIFKAGLMEIADIFVLNKADSPETDRTERQLRAMLELGGSGDKEIPVVKTIATEGFGVKELTQELLKFIQTPRNSKQARKRQQLLEAMVRDIVSQEVFGLIQKKINAKKLGELMQKLWCRQLDPYSLAEILLRTALEE
ncbi:MAG: methylmalonyl Co-A mutase-associated GTPase MeaB [Candidatus Aminicenantes bacterium]|nr:methylmalonyl Co-A mutase-associated GTPase MeaB [Candidatus Aminicenantes bacterium]